MDPATTPVTSTTDAFPISEALRTYLEVQYELLRPLGAGGMGVVLLARERALDRRVAIKVLHPGAAADPDARERFRREARIAARLTHPNIVPLYTFGEVQGELYFVMGYVEGETLSARLEREGQCEPEETQRILAEIADALEHAHSAGTVHRDLKPENILLDRESRRALLTDFGIARDVGGAGALTSTGTIVGTPHYMSPEQAAGDRALDGRSDLYSLGVVGYRMLSGSLPFGGADARAVIARHISAAPPPLPNQIVEEAPGLANSVMRALAKSPADRWADSAEMARALRAGDDAQLLPDALVDLDGSFVAFGLIGLVPVIALPVLQLLGVVDGFSLVGALAVGSVIAGICLLVAGLAFVATALRRPEPWRTLLRIACRADRAWAGWWPTAWRRPADVYERLPWELRVYSNLQLVGAFWLLLGITGVFWLIFNEAGHQWLSRYRLTGLSGVVGFWLGFLQLPELFKARLRRRLGIDAKVIQQAATLGNVDIRWREPQFAALLGKPARAVGGTSVSIDALLRDLESSGLPLPDGLSDAVASSRAARNALDREMQALREMVGSEELTKLDERLAGLRLGDSPLRTMLTSQRDLLVRAETRLGGLGALRQRLEAQEGLVRQQLIALKEFAAAGSDLDEITGRLRAARADLDRLAVSLDETRF